MITKIKPLSAIERKGERGPYTYTHTIKKDNTLTWLKCLILWSQIPHLQLPHSLINELSHPTSIPHLKRNTHLLDLSFWFIDHRWYNTREVAKGLSLWLAQTYYWSIDLGPFSIYNVKVNLKKKVLHVLLYMLDNWQNFGILNRT